MQRYDLVDGVMKEDPKDSGLTTETPIVELNV